MAAKGEFNIFDKNYKQPNKDTAVQLFSITNQNHNEGQEKPRIKEIISKRQMFVNNIRQQRREAMKKSIRQNLLKQLHNNEFFMLLEQLAAKNNVESKNISSMLSQLRRNMDDYEFCKKLDENNRIKQFVMNLYLCYYKQLGVNQKSLLVQSLIFLTYYQNQKLQTELMQRLTEIITNQLSEINTFDDDRIDYIRRLVDLLINITAEEDLNLNYHLMDTNIFPIIAEKITLISIQAQKLKQLNNSQFYNKYSEHLNDIRQSFIQILQILSHPKYTNNEFFFQFTINEFVNDRNYLANFGAKVLKVFANFFHNAKFRQMFIDNNDLIEWFQNNVPAISQKRFENPESIKTGKFENVIMTNDQKQIFFQFLNCILVWLDYEQDQAYFEMMQMLIQSNLNAYCLSEFLIQSAQTSSDDNSSRNSVYVAKAIQMFEYLADNRNITINQLLIVTSERHFEDILKVFLDFTYFTSFKISHATFSVLNKMLSKDAQILKTLLELRIFQSIDAFLEQSFQIQKQIQIVNFFELLTLMIVCDNELEKQSKQKQNNIARMLEINGLIKKIQKYQDHQNKEVANKAAAFLDFLGTVREPGTKQEVLEI